jgi:hypothetical protein
MRSCRSPDERSEIRVFTSPRRGEVGGRRAPGEGVRELTNKYARWNPLTPTLSPPGRGSTCLAALALFVICAVTPAGAADDLAVDVVNASVPTLCAEKDNVTLDLLSPTVRRFTVEATHPAYIGTITNDRAAPDFAHCEFAAAALAPAPARRITIFETEDWQLIGHKLPNFWRPSAVTVRVGDRVETGIHLLQLWTRYEERAEEVLVLYPPDGYWRARPLPPSHMRWTAYGSSFLLGPIENEGRPLVDIREVIFDPETRTFRLSFMRGGAGTVRLRTLDQERIVLEVALDPVGAERPFAALRSMFVTEANADVAQVGWRVKGSEAWQRAAVMDFKRASAVELWAGRTVPSRHNVSAPDMSFRDFSSAP